MKRFAKKFPSIKMDIAEFGRKLAENPAIGKEILPGCFKVRMAISSKVKGKSGGARIITHLHICQTTVYLLTIYDKSEQSDIKYNEVKYLLSLI